MSSKPESTTITEDELEFIQAVGRVNNTPSSANTLDKINSVRRRKNIYPMSKSYFFEVLHAGGCSDLKTVYGFRIDKYRKNIDKNNVQKEEVPDQEQKMETKQTENKIPENSIVAKVMESGKMIPVMKDAQLTSLCDPDVLTILKYISEESLDVKINALKDRFHWGYQRLLKVYKILENEGIITTPKKKREERKVNIDRSFVSDIIKDIEANMKEIEEIKVKNSKLDRIKQVYSSFLYILDSLGVDKVSNQILRYKQRHLPDDRYDLVVLQAVHAGVIKHQGNDYIIEILVLKQEIETPYGHRWIPEKYQYLIEVTQDDLEDKSDIDKINIDNVEQKEDKPAEEKNDEQETSTTKQDIEEKPEIITEQPEKQVNKVKLKIQEKEQPNIQNRDVSIKINGVCITLHNKTSLVSPVVQFEDSGIRIIF